MSSSPADASPDPQDRKRRVMAGSGFSIGMGLLSQKGQAKPPAPPSCLAVSEYSRGPKNLKLCNTKQHSHNQRKLSEKVRRLTACSTLPHPSKSRAEV